MVAVSAALAPLPRLACRAFSARTLAPTMLDPVDAVTTTSAAVDAVATTFEPRGITTEDTIVFVLGCVPAAVGGLYKEVVLSGSELDDNYLNAWVALYQSGLTVLCLPLHSLSVLGDDAVALGQLWPRVRAGAGCVLLGDGEVIETRIESRVVGRQDAEVDEADADARSDQGHPVPQGTGPPVARDQRATVPIDPTSSVTK